MKKTFPALQVAVALALSASTALAQPGATMKEQIEILQKALSAQQAQLDAQKKQIEAQQAQLEALLHSEAPATEQAELSQLKANVKFLLNYLRIDVDRLNPAGPGNPTPFGASPATPPLGAAIGQSLNAYALRTQYSF